MRRSVIILTVSGLFALGAAHAVEAPSEAQRIVSKYQAVFKGLPGNQQTGAAVRGPLLGNGHVAVTLSGPPEATRFWLARNDFWRYKSHDGQGYNTGVGYLDLHIPELKDATVRVEQDLYTATTRAVISKGSVAVTVHCYVAAEHPLLIVEMEATGQGLSGEISMTALEGGRSESSSGLENGVSWMVRKFERDVEIPSAVAVAARLLDAKGPSFDLTPGKPVRLVVALRSLFEGEDYLAAARNDVAHVDVDQVHAAHAGWWRRFWDRSWVEIGDPLLEQRYYLSNYVMGSCSRDPKYPPSLFGPWVTVNHPKWHGDYHLNYNYQAPFYGLYSSSHIEQAAPYHAPLLDFMERGRHYATTELNCRGIYYPIGLGPMGIETARYSRYGGNRKPGQFHQQKSYTAYCLVNMALHWYSTYDPAYAKELYPFVVEVANFWEDYLKWEADANRYVIYEDAIHEWSGPDMNNVMSLGMVRNAFELALDMSKEMGVDANRHGKWDHILEHLSPFPTQERGGKTVFRYSEKGTAWWKDNTVGIQHIYPAGAIGLESDPRLLEISRNTIAAMGRWIDNNGMSSFYPAAIRVGYDPDIILSQLQQMIRKVGEPNGFIARNPHGIENCSIVPNTINMMLCMGHQHVLRLFPVWPKNQDARFQGLRVWGAFLVSSELKDGKVQYVRIQSERGRPCTIQNPWPGMKVAVMHDDGTSRILSGDRLLLKTTAGQTLRLMPAS